MENTLPTAEEFTKILLTEIANCRGVRVQSAVVEKKFIEFAKLHVEAALQEAFLNSEMRVSENDTNEHPSFTDNYDDGYVTITVSKDSIINAYNFNNIK
jgi:hypothetical protein